MKTVFELTQYKLFPSPCRGLIFLTRRLSRTNLRQSLRFRPLAGDLSSLRWICQVYTMYARVSVPLQGTYLLYRRLCEKEWRSRSCFRPLTGDLSSLQFIWSGPFRDKGFRPLTGDLSSLHKSDICPRPNARFPSPCRGLIFLTS